MHLHVMHVAGKHMMVQGMDGLSRGDMLTGVFGGNGMLAYVPLHLSALEQSASLASWLLGWYPHPGSLVVLAPNDWFDLAINQRVEHCLWSPAPAAAEVAVEQLCHARLKRANSTHLIIIPRLMTSRWRKQLTKAADVVLTLPLGGDYWGVSQHEPLLLAICFPMLRFSPWRLKGMLIMEQMVGSVSQMPATSKGGLGIVLRELCLQAWALDTMPRRVVRPLLQR